MTTSRAVVATATPERYAKQLVSHLGRRIPWVTHGATSTADIAGASAEVVVGDAELIMTATGEVDAVAAAERVLGDHLVRFGQRQELVVAWERT